MGLNLRMLGVVAAAGVGVVGWAEPAAACGGCFHAPPGPVTQTTVVTGHRMAFAVSSERTVLWDQIKYDGPAEDFSWVLPVRPGSYIEQSSDAWFEALDGVTATRVEGPALRCAQSPPSGGCGCGGDLKAESAALSGVVNGGDPGVTIVHEGTVGPYDTVTLESTSGDSLSGWLTAHGYMVPDDIKPIIEAYVGEGFDFIALRLSPDQGVQTMTPVRVVTPGPEGPLPLRMVAAGIGASVDITLYVVGEGRYALPDLKESTLDPAALVWDYGTSTSNYLDLREEALAWYLGYRYLTTFAAPRAFTQSYADADGVPLRLAVNGNPVSTIPDAYFGRAAQLTPASVGPCAPIPSDDAALVDADNAGRYACGSADDIAAAFIGMHPNQVWLTRLEMDLPREALSADCVVSPNESQAAVSQFLKAEETKNPPCAQPIFESSIVSPRGMMAWLGVLAVALGSRLRRRSRA